MPNKLVMDMIGRGKAEGEVANYLASSGSFSPDLMRPWIDPKSGRAFFTVFTGGDRKDPKCYAARPATNATLRRDEWKELDDAILPLARTRLRGIQDLIDRGLTYNLGNALGTTVLEHHTIGDAFDAELTMDGITRSKGGRAEYGTVYTPVPIIHVDYQLNLRQIEASRKLGNPIDTSEAEIAVRKVSERLESMLFTDTSYSFGGGTIYSYLSYPNVNLYSLSAGWGGSGADPVADLLGMMQASIDANFFGPWVLYVPTSWQTTLEDDYNEYKTQTVRQRLEAIEGIEAIRVSSTLPDGKCVLVQMTKDVVRLVNGMPIQNVQWKEEGNFVTKNKVMCIQVPQIRSDHEGHCGIVLGSV